MFSCRHSLIKQAHLPETYIRGCRRVVYVVMLHRQESALKLLIPQHVQTQLGGPVVLRGRGDGYQVRHCAWLCLPSRPAIGL